MMSREFLLGVAALLATASLSAQDEKQPEQAPQARPHDLMVGDPAPPLAIQTWVKGDPVTGFAADKVYVVEFWATWCGPCIAGMPHLSALQEELAEAGVTIIGVNIWDEPAKVAPFMKNEVRMHKKPGNEIMRYTVAIEEKDDPLNVRVGKMAKQWMAAAGRNGIPSSFIVDQKARIAWIGHPNAMDQPLEQVVAGKWDLAAETRAYAARLAAQAEVDEYGRLFARGAYEKAYALGRKLVRSALANDAQGLNTLAWDIVDPDKIPKQQDLDLALEAAVRANELTKSEDPYILDTLAKVHHDRGSLAEALKWQRLAVEHAKGKSVEADIRRRLKQFEKKAAEAAGDAQKDR